MRKSKDIKIKRRTAGMEYKRGNRKDAYKLWSQAKTELDELKGRNKPVEEPKDAPTETDAEPSS